MHVGEVIDRARLPLNDAAKVRWPDDELRVYLHEAVLMARRMRPDLFIGRFLVSIPTPTNTTAFALPDEYAQAIADYVTARANMKDSDEADPAKAAQMLQLAMGGLR